MSCNAIYAAQHTLALLFRDSVGQSFLVTYYIDRSVDGSVQHTRCVLEIEMTNPSSAFENGSQAAEATT